MPPQQSPEGPTTTTTTNDLTQRKAKKSVENVENEKEFSFWDHIYYMNIFWFILLHVGAFYGLYVAITQAKLVTSLFAFFVYNLSLFGITAGVHRLWSHKAYKAVLPMRIFLAFCNSVSYQNSVFEWARDHRVHHKYTETDADPVNSKRGFFFSHVGWLLCKKHPDVARIGGKVDMSDILNDPVVYYQRKYYVPSVIISCFVLPTLIPSYFWGETLWNAYFVAVVLRYCLALNATWLVNSAAHMFGNRPYDENIAPVENLTVAALTLGEGYHNFHHTFPWDYSTSEWGWNINLTTVILDACEKLGLIYDVRRVSPEIIKARIARTGPNGKGEIVSEHEYC